jgi:hypothetical protein
MPGRTPQELTSQGGLPSERWKLGRWKLGRLPSELAKARLWLQAPAWSGAPG